MKNNTYTFIFAAVVCMVCSLALSAVSEGLKSKKAFNMALDQKKNILKAVGLAEALSGNLTGEQTAKLYQEKIEELVIDEYGDVVQGVDPETIDMEKTQGLYPLYELKENGEIVAHCFPIVGKGLWSTLYGYFAMNPDGKTVKGITFYKHGETPGLGAEIEKDWFQDHFKGKKVWSELQDKLVPIRVVKGKVQGRYSPQEAQFLVDGISGATMTGKGVTRMLERWLEVYEPFFKKIRKE